MAYRLGNRILKIDNKLFYASGAWTPLDIPNLRAWYGDYVNGGTLRTTLSNGANVTQWDDLSGNAFHMSQHAGSPIYDSAGNFIDFQSGGGCLYNSSHSVLSGNEARTYIIVAESGTANKSNNDFVWCGIYNGSNSYAWYLNTTSSAIGTNNGYGYAQTTKSVAANTKYIFSASHPNTGTFLTGLITRWNGILQTLTGSRDSTSNTYAGISVGGYIDIGGNPNYSGRGDVHAYEVIIYNRQLSTAEIQTVEAYLNTKYSIY